MIKGLKVFPVEIHYEENGSEKGKCMIDVRAMKLQQAENLAVIEFRMNNFNSDMQNIVITDVRLAA